MRQGVPVRVEKKWKIGKGRTSSYPIQTILDSDYCHRHVEGNRLIISNTDEPQVTGTLVG